MKYKLFEDLPNYIKDNWEYYLEKTTREITNKNFNILSTENMVKQIDIKHNKENGICFMTSLYNSYPEIFDTKENFEKILDTIKRYEYTQSVINYINGRLKPKNFLRLKKYSTNCKNLQTIIKNSIDLNIVIPLGYSNFLGGHYINIIGYDYEYIYYYENSKKDNIFIDDCINIYLELLRHKKFSKEDILKFGFDETVYDNIKLFNDNKISKDYFFNNTIPLLYPFFKNQNSKMDSISYTGLDYLYNYEIIYCDLRVLKNLENFSVIKKNINKHESLTDCINRLKLLMR